MNEWLTLHFRVLPRKLDGRLVGLGASVGVKAAIGERVLDQALCQLDLHTHASRTTWHRMLTAAAGVRACRLQGGLAPRRACLHPTVPTAIPSSHGMAWLPHHRACATQLTIPRPLPGGPACATQRTPFPSCRCAAAPPAHHRACSTTAHGHCAAAPPAHLRHRVEQV